MDVTERRKAIKRKLLIGLGLIGFFAVSLISWSAYDHFSNGSQQSATGEEKSSGSGGGLFGLFKGGGKKPLRVCVVTWPGYAGGQYFNGGFKASTNSRYWKELGIQVEFIKIDDYDPSRAAWKNGEVDVLWTTADSFSGETDGLQEFVPMQLFQADWSRGGDAIVAAREIKRMEDLRGQKVAVSLGTPSYTLLLAMLKAAGMTLRDIQVVKVNSTADAGPLFKNGSVKAAVVWAPDDEDCLDKVPGAHILKSTKDANYLIGDTFYVKKEVLENRSSDLVALVKGWLIGNREINDSPAAKAEAIRLVADGLNVPEQDIKKTIDKVRLATYGDNVNFFGLNSQYTGVRGEDLYNNTAKMYMEAGFIRKAPVPWRSVTNLSVLKAITDLNEPGDAAERATVFTQATKQDIEAPAVASQLLPINFATGSAVLDDEAKRIIDENFAFISRTFGDNRIRVEGHTDNVGNPAANQALSDRRAQAAVNYIVSQYHLNPKKFVAKGYGSSRPVDTSGTDEARQKNRRTEFQLLSTTVQ